MYLTDAMMGYITIGTLCLNKDWNVYNKDETYFK